MGKVNGCLRGVFIAFNVLFAILGCFLAFSSVKATAYSHQASEMGTPGLGWSWVLALGMLAISCLGIYAGYSEKLLPLKIFAGFMVVGMVIMLILGFIMVVAKNKIVGAFQSSRSEITELVMTDESMKELLEQLQLEGHCCGVHRPEDWGSSIPDSCDCTYATEGLGAVGLGTTGCQARPYGSDGPDKIYPRPCGDLILSLVSLLFQVAMGIFFGLAVSALLGLLLSFLMIRQVKGRQDAGDAFAMKGQYL